MNSLFLADAPFPLREGNAIVPLIDGFPAFRRICQLIDDAQERVWVTVTFMWPSFEMPDERGSPLRVLQQAAARGVDVRVIFWRPEGPTEALKRNAFWGSEDHLELLKQLAPGVKVCWDRAEPGFCQHQKSWLVDSVAVIGGINMNPHSLVAVGHPGGGGNHDLYVELTGPSTHDVAANFVQRWNGATDPAPGRKPLTLPNPNPEPCGKVTAQIQRTLPPNEFTNLHQILKAIAGAQHSIYIENQSIAVPDILDALLTAARRGVEVVLLMPAESDPLFLKMTQENPDLYTLWKQLLPYENFTLAGIAGLTQEGTRKPIYVHSKLMLIDDAWATVGSCNLHRFSLFGNAEMNVAFADTETVHRFRVELFQEHLGVDTSHLGATEAHRHFRQIAKANRSTEPSRWSGLAFELDPPV